MMRVVDAGIAIPALFLLLVTATISAPSGAGPDPDHRRRVLAGAGPARTRRGAVAADRDYVQAMRAMGGGHGRAVFRHIIPNAIGTVVVNATFQVADAILLIAYVTFLGLGVAPPKTDWGGMLSKGISYTYDGYWWLIFPAGIAIVLVVCAFNAIGDGLRDAFEVRLQGRGCTAERRPTAATPALAFEDLDVSFTQRPRRPCTRSTASASTCARRDRRRRRRVRLRQDLTAAAVAGPAARRAPASPGRPLSAATTCSTLDEARAGRVRGAEVAHGLPGADDRAEPGSAGRLPDRRGAPRCTATACRGQARERAVELLELVRHPRRRARRLDQYPHELSGGHAPAGHDRDGAGLRADAAHRRRAHHRAGRHRAGGDPRPAARPARRDRHGDAADHPRHGRGRRHRRPGRGHVPGRGRRAGRRRRTCSPRPQDRLHRAAAGRGAAAARAARDAAVPAPAAAEPSPLEPLGRSTGSSWYTRRQRRTRRSARSTRSRSPSPRARCSGWSASPGPARPPSGRAALGLVRPTAGTVRLLRATTSPRVSGRERCGRCARASRIVLQDPASSLNPRMTVGECVAEPLGCTGAASGGRAEPGRDAARLRSQLPAARRATATRTSSPAASGSASARPGAGAATRAADRRRADQRAGRLGAGARCSNCSRTCSSELGFACLFITHDLAVVGTGRRPGRGADRGRLVEAGPRDRVLSTRPSTRTRAACWRRRRCPIPVAQRERRVRAAELRAARD